MTAADSLIGLVNPQPNSTVMIYDVHASESGALAILDTMLLFVVNQSQKKHLSV